METKPIANFEAESYVLGYMLLNHDVFQQCVRRLVPADFFDSTHRTIFKVLTEFCQSEVDEYARASVCWEMLRRKTTTKAASVELARLIADFKDWAKSAHDVAFWTRTLIDVSQRRATVIFAGNLVDAAQSVDSDYMAVLKENYDAITSRALSTERVPLVGGLVGSVLEDMEASKGGANMVTSGFDMIDSHCGGFEKGEMVCVGALTGVGKSAFAMACAIHAAQQGRSVAYFSLEMTNDQLQKRILANLSGVNLSDITKATYTKSDRSKIVEASNQMHSWKLAIYDRGVSKMKDIWAKATAHRNDHGIDLIVIDYLQLIRPSNSKLGLFEAITEASKDAKEMAKEFRVPVIGLAQLNREAVKEADPRKHHLKGSGSLAEDADKIVLLSHRLMEDNEERQPNSVPVRIRLDKVRQGQETVFRYWFNGAHQKYISSQYDFSF